MAWRVTCTGTQMKRFLPCLPIGERSSFALDEKELSPNELLHRRGECQPCAYFAFRADGCRAGASCEFCHLCTKSQAKSKKKANRKIVKAAFAEATLSCIAL